MSNPTIRFFVKTFTNALYANRFLDGLLYMNSIDYFVRQEESDSTGRGDCHESTCTWLQPDKIQIEIFGIPIDSGDLAGPVSMQLDRHLGQNIFCMHASYIGGNAPSEFATTNAFEQHLKIPQQNISLGQHSVVITNVREFLSRVKAAATEKNVSLRGRLVDYYDPTTFHGHFADEDAPFNKQMHFSHQREYRLLVSRRENDASPYSLNIGNLRDIAHMSSIEEFNAAIKVSPIINHPLA